MHSVLNRLVVLSVVSLLGACTPPAPQPDAMTCGLVGRTSACACTDGQMGAQACRADGMLGPCVCTGPGGDSALDVATDATDDRAPIGMDAPLDAPDAREAGVPTDATTDTPTDGSAVPSWDGTLPASGVCSIDGWCWRNPLPGRVAIHSVWGSSTTDVWAVGRGRDSSALLYWNGTQWTGITDVPLTLGAISGSGPSDAWITSGSDFVRWNGVRWSPVSSGSTATLAAISVRATDDAWAVGQRGTILRWDGTRWTSTPSGTSLDLNAVFARAADDAWAVGNDRVVLQWDGTRWNERSAGLPATGNVTAVWSAARDEAWIVIFRTIYRWNGTTWLASRTLTESPSFITGSSRTDVLALTGSGSVSPGVRWDGTSWSAAAINSSCGASAAWAVGPRDYFIGSLLTSLSSQPTDFCGLFRLSDPFSTTTRYVTYPFGMLAPRAVLAIARNDLLLQNSDALWYRGDGRTFTAMAPLPSGAGPLRAFAGGEIWSFGPDVVARWTGTSWERRTPATPTAVRATPETIWANSASDVWVTDRAAAAHWNGTTWTTTPAIPSGAGGTIWGIGPSEAWSAGPLGTSHWNGSAWSPVSGFGGASLWGRSATEVYLADIGGGVSRWDGTRWTRITTGPLPVSGFIEHFWWRDEGDLWATGGPRVFRWTAGTWRVSPAGFESEVSAQITGISGTASDDVWLIGGNRIVMHRGP